MFFLYKGKNKGETTRFGIPMWQKELIPSMDNYGSHKLIHWTSIQILISYKEFVDISNCIARGWVSLYSTEFIMVKR